ncbi:MAG TPA: hypothetical protein PKH97_15230, partial [Tetrasphaera sp.]|nr:hypothetical protein [Tetrasphaera sp.]
MTIGAEPVGSNKQNRHVAVPAEQYHSRRRTLEPSELQSVIGRVIALTEEMQAAGVWVFAMPLADPSSATDRLTPSERVAFVLHDSFGFEFPMIADLLEASPAAARKLASRAPAKVAAPMAQDQLADWEVV